MRRKAMVSFGPGGPDPLLVLLRKSVLMIGPATEQPLKSPGPAPLSSQVHAAAVNGDRSSLQKLITAEPCLRDSEDQFGRTPLMYCVLADRSDCAETLLKAGASVNKADRSKRTALHLAAQKGNVRFMKLLLSRHANWLLKDVEEMTPLHLATRHPSHKPLSLLLKHMAPGEVDTQDRNKDAAPTESLLNWQDYEGRTPLHFAVADGNEAVVEVLTSYEGCSVTAYDNLFRTPLHWAALLGTLLLIFHCPDTVVVFLKHHSVRDEPDLEGRTAFMWAAGKGSNDVINVMLELKRDLDINMADKYGGTGAIVDPLDVMKHTPLFRACEMGHRDVILTLIKGGARVDLVDTDGHSALHWAALGGNAEVCEVLMENGLGPNLQDHAGRTPLQCAAYAGYINCMALLIQHDADPNIQDKEHTEERKREEERRREARQQLSLAGAQNAQILLVQVESERTPLTAAELSLQIKDMKLKGHKHGKSSKAHQSQSHDMPKKTPKKPKESEHSVQTPDVSQLSASNLSMTSQSTSTSDTTTHMSVSGVSTPENCVTRPERHSPAGSSRPGSARRTNPAHSRPRTLGRTPETKTSHPVVASPPAAVGESGSIASVPIQAPQEKSRIRDPRAEGQKAKASRSRREKERKTEIEEETETCPRIEREAERFSEREKERGGRKEVEKGKRTDKDKELRRKDLRRRNQAARVIQTAWRRFCVWRRLKELLCKKDLKSPPPAEVTALLIQFLWERPVHMDNPRQRTVSRAQSPPAKAAAKKSSVLQSIYVSGVECVHLLDSLNQAKQYSYHLRPQSASSQSRTKD
ncbi:Inversin [Bagarius yarrelli]|uniref:Inversin n=1 Tax=Bagarius yarrelli TaxID=175774 RepID=A0A556TM30_BAGYA|nr:Inversin [Bagarius yarrelli]